VTSPFPPPLAAPAEAWWLWVTVVAVGVVAGLIIAWLRRVLLQPFRHGPTDTTDAWAEAGRRFRLPEADEGDRDGAGPAPSAGTDPAAPRDGDGA